MKSNLYKRVLIFSFFFLCVFIYGHQEVSAYCSDPNGCLTIYKMLDENGDYNDQSHPSLDYSPYIYYSYEEPEPEYGYSTHNIEEVIGYLDGDINTSGSCSVTNDSHDGGIIQCGPNFVSGHNIYIRMRVSGNPYAYVWYGPRFFYTQASPPPYSYETPYATPPYATPPPCTSGPSGYTKCADENGTCSFSGTADVAYGCNGSYNTHSSVVNSTACNNSTFGDPIPGTAKACFWKTSYAYPYPYEYPYQYEYQYQYQYQYPTPPATYNDASLVSYSVPGSVTAGQSFPVSITMKNTGTKTWAVTGEGNAGDYNLGAYDNLWGWARQSVGGNISPGSNKTFSWTATAPSTAGQYSFAWKMVAEWQEWFGQQVSIPITVNPSYAYEYPYPYQYEYQYQYQYQYPYPYQYEYQYQYQYQTPYATPPPAFDYTLSQPANVSVTKGGIDQYGQTSVTRTLTSGSTESVTLSVSGVPAGVGYSVSNNGCTPNCSSTILFTVHPTASAGSYSITVTGSPLGHSKTFTLTIVASSAIISTCTPSSATPDINTSVTWSATASGGTPPYTYTWTGTNLPTSPAPSTQSFSISYSTIGNKTAQISIRDSIGNTGVCLPVGTLNVQFDPKFEEI